MNTLKLSKKEDYIKLDYFNGVYLGYSLNHSLNGKGIFLWDEGSIIISNFKLDSLCGKGLFIFRNQLIFFANFNKSALSGKGKILFPNGDIIIGNFNENKFDGENYIFNKSEKKWIIANFKLGVFKTIIKTEEVKLAKEKPLFMKDLKEINDIFDLNIQSYVEQIIIDQNFEIKTNENKSFIGFKEKESKSKGFICKKEKIISIGDYENNILNGIGLEFRDDNLVLDGIFQKGNLMDGGIFNMEDELYYIINKSNNFANYNKQDTKNEQDHDLYIKKLKQKFHYKSLDFFEKKFQPIFLEFINNDIDINSIDELFVEQKKIKKQENVEENIKTAKLYNSFQSISSIRKLNNSSEKIKETKKNKTNLSLDENKEKPKSNFSLKRPINKKIENCQEENKKQEWNMFLKDKPQPIQNTPVKKTRSNFVYLNILKTTYKNPKNEYCYVRVLKKLITPIININESEENNKTIKRSQQIYDKSIEYNQEDNINDNLENFNDKLNSDEIIINNQIENNDYNYINYNSDDCPKSFDKLDNSFISEDIKLKEDEKTNKKIKKSFVMKVFEKNKDPENKNIEKSLSEIFKTKLMSRIRKTPNKKDKNNENSTESADSTSNVKCPEIRINIFNDNNLLEKNDFKLKLSKENSNSPSSNVKKAPSPKINVKKEEIKPEKEEKQILNLNSSIKQETIKNTIIKERPSINSKISNEKDPKKEKSPKHEITPKNCKKKELDYNNTIKNEKNPPIQQIISENKIINQITKEKDQIINEKIEKLPSKTIIKLPNNKEYKDEEKIETRKKTVSIKKGTTDNIRKKTASIKKIPSKKSINMDDEDEALRFLDDELNDL